jgi:hypothetical protein
MLYILAEPPVVRTTKADQDRFVASAIAVVERTERWLAESDWLHQPTEVEDVLRLANFVADLHACIQLWLWEKSGEVRHLSQGLPTFADAIVNLKNRIVAKPKWFLQIGPSSSELFELVAGVRARDYRFSPELGGVFLVAELDEDALVEALSQLIFQLWKQSDGLPQKTGPSCSAVRSDDYILAELASIPGITVTPIPSGMNYDVALL